MSPTWGNFIPFWGNCRLADTDHLTQSGVNPLHIGPKLKLELGHAQ